MIPVNVCIAIIGAVVGAVVKSSVDNCNKDK
jgi:hypothetical protein